MVSTKRNEEAVSPVIGVILMVAVTVILAAIIAAFVFGMAGNIQSTKVVAFTAKMDTGDVIRVTSMGGNDWGKLTSVAATVNNAAVSAPSTSIGVTSSLGTGTPGSSHVVLVGTFNDGTKQVILDTTV